MDDTLEKAPKIKVDGLDNQGLTRVPGLCARAALVDCGRRRDTSASSSKNDDSNSAIAFLIQKNRRKSKRCVFALKGDPTLFLFSGVICPTSVPPIA